METVIAPGYEHLAADIANIVQGNYTAAHTYCNRRNMVEKVICGSDAVVVKRFKRPNIINRVAYTWFRPSKPRRAYEYGRRIAALGFSTPAPVAYIEQRKGLCFHTGWFISLCSEDTPFSQLYAQYKHRRAAGDTHVESKITQLREQLIDFILQLQAKRVRPGDFNHDNILVHENESGFHFALVDINRMHFEEQPTLKRVMKMFSQFCRDYQDAVDFLSVYARKAGLDFDECMYVFSKQRNHLLQRKKRKQKLHSFFG